MNQLIKKIRNNNRNINTYNNENNICINNFDII